jgi:hypothetical protein
MPIHVDLSHHNRIVVAVIRGPVTAQDITDAVKQFVATGAWHYRKMIDVSSGDAALDEPALEMLATMARTNAGDSTRGPLAFVIDPARGDRVARFVDITAGERPVKMFRSIHEARRWLDENTER